jgi:hypothetical protein
MAAVCFARSPRFEIALVFVRFNHVARCIVNANHIITDPPIIKLAETGPLASLWWYLAYQRVRRPTRSFVIFFLARIVACAVAN